MDIKRMCQTIRYMLFLTSTQRSNYIRKKKLFGSIGEDVFLPFMIIPLRCENIFLGNNIEIASGVKLIPHDAIHGIFNRMDKEKTYSEHIGRIKIKDNVFIGANAIILGPCEIGPNVVVAAGAVVNRDIPPETIVGGYLPEKLGILKNLKRKEGI